MSEGSFCQGQLQDYFVKLKFPTAELMISSCDQAFKFPVRLIESSSAPTIHCHHFKLTPCLLPPFPGASKGGSWQNPIWGKSF